MPDKPAPILDQVEDAVLKFVPAVGGIFGGFAGAGLLGKSMTVFLAFVIGGAVGGLAVGLTFMLLFRIINPKRDRRSKSAKSAKRVEPSENPF
jgi:hypothetical protein